MAQRGRDGRQPQQQQKQQTTAIPPPLCRPVQAVLEDGSLDVLAGAPLASLQGPTWSSLRTGLFHPPCCSVGSLDSWAP